ncbi:MAG: hypothetical protein MJA29_13110 [Candidatus Omnitrophica bacterium]|nr:hypothetical protein [Candidatus Omnitrophota bacterium]
MRRVRVAGGSRNSPEANEVPSDTGHEGALFESSLGSGDISFRNLGIRPCGCCSRRDGVC